MPTKLPLAYQKDAIASALASKLVYQEGIHLVESQPEARLATRAIMYIREDRRIVQLARDLEAGLQTVSLTDEQRAKMTTIVDLIRRGGARTSLGIF